MIDFEKPFTFLGELAQVIGLDGDQIKFTVPTLPGVTLSVLKSHPDLYPVKDFEVGQVWKARDGWFWVVKVVGLTGKYPVKIERVDGAGADAVTLCGRVSYAAESLGDMVELMTEGDVTKANALAEVEAILGKLPYSPKLGALLKIIGEMK
jgi:hypothetical protein